MPQVEAGAEPVRGEVADPDALDVQLALQPRLEEQLAQLENENAELRTRAAALEARVAALEQAAVANGWSTDHHIEPTHRP